MWKGIYGVFSNISNLNISIETRYKKQELTRKHLTYSALVKCFTNI